MLGTIKDKQILTALKYNHTLVRMTLIKKLLTTTASEDTRKAGPFFTVYCWECKLAKTLQKLGNHHGNQYEDFS